MKYTNYILSNKVININAIQAKNPILVLPMAAVSLPLIILGFLLILFTLPAAATMDQQRKLKLFLIRFERINNYQYGSQTHISNLLRDYIRIPIMVSMGPRTSTRKERSLVIFRKTRGTSGTPWYNNNIIMDNILPDMGRILLVVKNLTHSREYG
jgi:hypothetical protein